MRRFRRAGVPVSWLIFFAALLGLGVLATVVVAVVDWRSGWTQPDRIATLGAIFAASAVYIALVAGVIALVAYVVASERPNLRIELLFTYSEPDKPELFFDPTFQPYRLGSGGQLQFIIRLHNDSQYSARSPAVRVELFNIGPPGLQIGGQSGSLPPWGTAAPTSDEVVGGFGVVWLAGANVTVHGPDWYIDLPPLSLANSELIEGVNPRLAISAVAEGDSKSRDYVIEVVHPNDWRADDPSRSAKMPAHLA